MKLTLLLISTLLLCSCAVTREKKMQETAQFELPSKPTEQDGIVYLVRTGASNSFMFGMFSYFSRFDVEVNGVEVGANRNDEFTYFYAKPGEYRITSRGANTDSHVFTVKAGQTTYVNLFSYPGIFSPNTQVREINEIDAKYEIMNRSPGIMKTDRFPASSN